MTTNNLAVKSPDPDHERFREAVEVANVPTLLMLLVQLTGDLHWLEDPYRPQREGGLGDNDSGGLPPEIQDEIRSAALDAILAWRAGREVALQNPPAELLKKMLSVSMSEDVPPEYGPMIAAQLGIDPLLPEARISAPEGFKVLIIGAGVGGICAGVFLKAAGIAFEIIERKDDVGGVWSENAYPGAGVDTPSYSYSFSFGEFDWSMYFALRDEICNYLNSITDQFDLRKDIHFETEVLRAVYLNDEQLWEVTTRSKDGSTTVHRANVVISAVGIFGTRKKPDIDGLENFSGDVFHTTEWPRDFDLSGKRVALLGTGATAMQIAPEIQNVVEHLEIFQRSCQWAAPFPQFRKSIPEPVRLLLREVPLYRDWYRARLSWTFNDRIYETLQKDPDWPHPDRSLNAVNDAHRKSFERYIRSELGERIDLLDKVLPTYPPFGKRMLLDNGWFRMLRNPKVQLTTDKIQRVAEGGIITEDGALHPADVIILSTGFEVTHFLSPMEIRGRSGETLRDKWEDDNGKAFLGMAVPDFPNFFCITGPNGQPGHGGSIVFLIEMQVRYIVEVIRKMTERGAGSVECKPESYERYNEKVDSAHANMVWTHPGMSTYYRNSRGRIVALFPFRNIDMYLDTMDVDLDADYFLEPRVAVACNSAA